MSKKLPKAKHNKLVKALSSGRLPDHGEPGYNDVYDIFGDLSIALGEVWTDKNASPVRRHVSALVDFWSAIAFDGLRVGVACNQPHVVPAAIEAAGRLKLPALKRVLTRVQRHIPPSILALEDPEDRLNWYDSRDGEAHARALEELEAEIQDPRLADRLILTILRQTLDEPAEFYRTK